MKRILALLLSAMLIATTVAVPLSAAAESADDSAGTDTDMSVEGSNSFGNLLADEMQDAMPNNDEGEPEYGITDVVVEGNTATVSYYAELDCTIVVALYDEESGEMLASGYADVLAVEESADITIDTDSMPQYFALKAFIIDSENNPLSESYATGIYTEAIQFVKNMEVSDFDSDVVLNLDDDETTNFAVFTDGIKIIQYTENYNIPVNTSPSDNVYVFTNCNDDFKSLSVGDAISYTYGDEVILIKIAGITVDGDTVTIKNEDNADMETFFNYVKVEGEATTADVVYDSTGADESVTFDGLVNENDQIVDGMHSSGDGSLSTNLSLKFTIGEGKIEGDNKSSDADDNDSYADGSLKMNAELKLSVEVKVDFYYNSSWNPIKNIQELKNAELKFSSDIKINLDGGFTAKGALNSVPLGCFKIFPAVGVSVDFTPRVKFSASIAITFSAVIEKHFAFSYSFAEGLNDASSPIKITFSVKISGEIYLGVDFGPKISLLSDELVNVKLTLEAGAKVTGSISETSENTAHLCKACVSGEVKAIVKFGISINLFNTKSDDDNDNNDNDKKSKFSVGQDFSLERKFADYYYSFDYDDVGFGKCPHYMQFHKNETTGLIDEGTCGDNVKWAFYESGNLYIYGSGDMADYDMAGYDFRYEPPWYSYCGEISNTIIEPGVTSIGDYAFYCCYLTNVTIPDSVTSIGDYAFYYCCYLTSITIPDSVTSIGDYAFAKCSGLASIKIPDSVTSIGDYAFTYCHKLTSVTIGNGVTSIGDGAFSGCDLTSIKIPDSVTSIGDYTFSGCGYLTSIKIPDSVTSIGDYAFTYCHKLTSVTIGNGVTSIGCYAFQGCDKLTSVTIPNSMTSIGDYTFSDCEGLTSITIPDSVTRIGNYAFQKCSNLTSVTFSNSVKSIGEYAFSDCEGLTSITIPDRVTSIGNYAFQKCSNLTSVTFSNSMKSIGEYAFADCSSLTSLTIPNSMTSIGDYAFAMCSGLTSIKIPNSVTSIGTCAFYYCKNLTSITIPNSVTNIGNHAFWACKGLTSLPIPNSVTSIERGMFLGCDGLTSITIPNSVTSIESAAFYGCQNLVSVTIPNTVTSIGDNAFYNCSSLTSITIPDSVKSIGASAFRLCDSLTSVTIGNGVTEIEPSMFDNCNSLTSVTIGSGMTNIAEFTFSGFPNLININVDEYNKCYASQDGVLFNKNLTEIVTYPTGRVGAYTIPDSVTSIGGHTFYMCGSLTSIIIPNSVTSIGERAFLGSSALTDVYYSGTEEEWSYISIGDYNSCLTDANIHYNYSPSNYSLSKSYAVKPTASALNNVVNTLSEKTAAKTTEQFSNLTPGGQYVFMVVRSEDVERLVASDNLVYINQYTADEDGNITIEYAADSDDNLKVLIFGIGVDGTKTDTPDTPDKPIKDSDTDIDSDTETEVDTDKEHKHTAVIDEEVAPTCTENGLTEGTHCSECGEVLTPQEVIPATGHTVVTDEEVAPTCTENGLTEGTHCSECGEVLTPQEVIPAAGHTVVTDEEVAPTCIENGLTEGTHCSECGEVLTPQEVIPANGHNYVDGVCNVCGEDDPTYDIPDTPDSPDNPNPPKTYIKGDITGDGRITASDALIILRAAVGARTLNEVEFQIADSNSDGKITAPDALMVLRCAVGAAKDTDVGKTFEFNL